MKRERERERERERVGRGRQSVPEYKKQCHVLCPYESDSLEDERGSS